MKKKITVVVVALSLVFCFAVGGTLAWLVDKTDEVTNTFTYGDINIELSETTGTEYKMVPGKTITKDPKVTVEADSEACWLFVKVEKSKHYSVYLAEPTIAEGWTALTGADGVYYRAVAATTADTDYQVLAGNMVTVLDAVTKEKMEDIKNGTVEKPTLTFTAYAIQQESFATPAFAWTEINKYNK